MLVVATTADNELATLEVEVDDVTATPPEGGALGLPDPVGNPPASRRSTSTTTGATNTRIPVRLPALLIQVYLVPEFRPCRYYCGRFDPIAPIPGAYSKVTTVPRDREPGPSRPRERDRVATVTCTWP